MASKEQTINDDGIRQKITAESKVELDNEIRIVLIGRTGSGKSSTGNTIMNETYFVAKPSASSVTKKCMIGETKRNENTIRVVDTPGFFDTNVTSSSVKLEILQCLTMLYPGPNIIMYVLKVRRFTKEEMMAVQHFLYLFGGDPFRYTMIVITGRDDLEKEGTTPSMQFMKEQDEYFLEFVSKCGNRVIFLNNRSMVEQERQFEDMYRIIEKTIQDNAKTLSFYTNEILDEIKRGIYKSSLDRLIVHGATSMLQKYKRCSGYFMIVVGAGLIVCRRRFLGIFFIGVGFIFIKIKLTTSESTLAKVVRQLERNNSPCSIS